MQKSVPTYAQQIVDLCLGDACEHTYEDRLLGINNAVRKYGSTEIKLGCFGPFVIEADGARMRLSYEEVAFKAEPDQNDIEVMKWLAIHGLRGYRTLKLTTCVICKTLLRGTYYEKLLLCRNEGELSLKRTCSTLCYNAGVGQALKKGANVTCQERGTYRDYHFNHNGKILACPLIFFIAKMKINGNTYSLTYFWLNENEVMLCPDFKETYPDPPAPIVLPMLVPRTLPIVVIELSDGSRTEILPDLSPRNLDDI
jgi:hypothetical protein